MELRISLRVIAQSLQGDYAGSDHWTPWKRVLAGVSFRGKHEIHDLLLTGAPVDFQIPVVREYPVTRQKPCN